MDNSHVKKQLRLRSATIIALAAGLAYICPATGPIEAAVGQETGPANSQPVFTMPGIYIGESDVYLITRIFTRSEAPGLLLALGHGMLPGQSWQLPTILLPLAAREMCAFCPGLPRGITLSPETTRITEPLNADGTVNYVKYLNDKHSKGVTANNNAAVPLLLALGPDILPDKIRKETVRRLKLPASFFDSGKHFVKWEDRTNRYKAAASRPAESQEDPDAEELELFELFPKAMNGKVHPDLKKWLADNAGALDLVHKASAKKEYYLPLISTESPVNLCEVPPVDVGLLHEVAQALTIRAAVKMLRNDCRGAWDDILAVHRLASLVGRGPMLLDQLIAVGLNGTAARAGTALATRGNMSIKHWQDTLAKLQALGPPSDVVRTFDKAGRLLVLDQVALLYRGKDVSYVLTGEHRDSKRTLKKHQLDWNLLLRDINA